MSVHGFAVWRGGRAEGLPILPALASTVQKTKQWIGELMREIQWQDPGKSYRGMRVVLHALRDRLTTHEVADLAAQLPRLIRGMHYEGWQPDRHGHKDRSREEFLSHVLEAFPNDPSVDREELTQAVFRVLQKHVSEGE